MEEVIVTSKKLRETCRKCGKVIEGYTKPEVKHNLKIHQETQHSKKKNKKLP